MRLRRAVPAGLLDAGLASLSTFAVGLAATRLLDAAALGVYTLFFTAFVVAAVVPTQLLFLPAEIAVLVNAPSGRAAVWRQTLAPGVAVAVAASAAGTAAALWTAGAAGAAPTAPLAATAFAAGAISPLQDHVRRALHLAARSWRAAAVSAVQFAGVVGALVALWRLGAPPGWIPLGALALANVASLTLGLLLARSSSEAPRVAVRSVLRSGRWLLVLGLAPAAAAFAAAAIISRVSGPEALGYAEAARIVAHPLNVVALGLLAVVGPRLMEAGARGDRRTARRLRVTFSLVLVAAAAGYAAVVTVPWTLNPLAALVPQAYVVGGLVAASLAQALHSGLLSPARSQLLGAKEEVRVARLELAGAVAQTAVAFSAAAIGAFARPLAAVAHTAVLDAGFRRALHAPDPPEPASAGAAGDRAAGDGAAGDG